jgi:hypothetical protein
MLLTKENRDSYDSMKVAKIGLQSDIYSLAYAAFIDPDQLDPKIPGGLQKINMNEDEVMNIFIAALMVIGCQICMIGMIIYYELTSSEFEIMPSDSYIIILARFLSSVMMHLNVEPEIRAGLVLSKYCLNHPSRFKGAYERGPNGEEIINYSRILPPLFLGLAQVIVGLIVEINILVYLTSIKSLLGVITQFITLASICKFDDMYAANLYENKML